MAPSWQFIWHCVTPLTHCSQASLRLLWTSLSVASLSRHTTKKRKPSLRFVQFFDTSRPKPKFSIHHTQTVAIHPHYAWRPQPWMHYWRGSLTKTASWKTWKPEFSHTNSRLIVITVFLVIPKNNAPPSPPQFERKNTCSRVCFARETNLSHWNTQTALGRLLVGG